MPLELRRLLAPRVTGYPIARVLLSTAKWFDREVKAEAEAATRRVVLEASLHAGNGVAAETTHPYRYSFI